MEPPPSVPWAAGTMPAATAAAAPPLEPPGTALEVPGIAASGPFTTGSVGGIETKLRRVRAPEDDEPGRFVALDQGEVVIGDEAVIEAAAVANASAFLPGVHRSFSR